MQTFSDQECVAMLDDLESDRIERKQTWNKDIAKRAREAICAFANDLPGHNQPGVLFIGAKDDGSPTDIEITDDMQLSMADMKTDGKLLPFPSMSVQKRRLKGADMAVIVVQPSVMPPVKFDGRIWIRIGSRRGLATSQDEQILFEKRRYQNVPFDLQPMPTATIEDLSRLIFENEYLPAAVAADVLAENNRTYVQRLAACRMIFSLDNPTPTTLGLLTIGKRPQDILPGATIQFLRIAGDDLADDVVDEALIGGNLVQMLRQAEEKMGAHNRTAINIVAAPTHRQTYDYPPAALRQILYNAVLHRTYESTNMPVRIYWFDDRVEITSPGGPYGNVTQENFGNPGVTDYRNPNLAMVLKDFGYVQQFGRGIAIAKREMELNGNPPLSFNVEPTVVQCILRKRTQ